MAYRIGRMGAIEVSALGVGIVTGILIGLNVDKTLNYIEETFSEETATEQRIEEKYNVRLIGDTTPEKLDSLEQTIDYIAQTFDPFNLFIQNVEYIKIRRNNLGRDEFDYLTKTMTYEVIEGYHFYSDEVHELTHAYYFGMPKETREDFLKKWRETRTPDFIHFVEEEELFDYFPKDYMTLTKFDAEDVANINGDSYFMRLHLLTGGNPNDFRTTVVPHIFYKIKDHIGTEKMLKRLALLTEYGFMSPREQEIMKPLALL